MDLCKNVWTGKILTAASLIRKVKVSSYQEKVRCLCSEDSEPPVFILAM